MTHCGHSRESKGHIMCIFAGTHPIDQVSGTQIFARVGEGSQQLLAYSMNVAAPSDVAMILPLPIPPGCGDDALRFIDLSAYHELFEDLNTAFPVPRALSSRRAQDTTTMPVPSFLVVHDVGAFEASFVPSQADFSRLDPRFRIAPEVWAQLPVYEDYGFAVFKLKFDRAPTPSHSHASGREPQGRRARRFGRTHASPRTGASKTFHPMAFSFPRRHAKRLFFPTVHIHDGAVQESAAFDHTLYCQRDLENTIRTVEGMPSWEQSMGPASEFVDITRSAGLLAPNKYIFRTRLRGQRANQDTWETLS